MKKRQFIKISVMAVMLSALGGCGMFSKTTSHEPMELASIENQVRLKAVWKMDVSQGASDMLTPNVTSNAIYVAGGDKLYRLDPQTGKEVWSVKTSSPVTAGVGSDGMHIAVGTQEGDLELFDVEGHLVWHVNLSSEIEIPPLVGQGLVVVKTSDTRISAFDIITGQRAWHYQGQTPALTTKTYKELAWSPAGILVGQENGRLLALSAEGKPVFDLVVAHPKGITEVERLVDVVGRPWVDNELMIAAAFQGKVLALRTQNAQTVWSQSINAVSGVFSDSQGVYVVDEIGRIHALTRTSGQELWKNSELLYRSASQPIRIGAGIAVADYEGVVSLMNPVTGSFIARMELDGPVTTPAQAYEFGAIYQTTTGEISYVVMEPLGR